MSIKINKLKKETGSITLFVLVAVIFFLAMAFTAYTSSLSKKQAQDLEYAKIKANYESSYTDEEIKKMYTETIKEDVTSPTASLSAGTVSSSRSSVLTASVSDNESGISKYEIYVNNSKVSTSASYTITNMEFNKTYSCYVIATDVAGNTKQSDTITVINQAYIATATDLKNLATAVNSGNNFSGKTITQTANIDLGCSSSNQWTPIGNSTYKFAGTYNGNLKTISNIYINVSNDYQGLFGYNSGTIENITLSSGTIKGNNYVGGIAGFSTGTISLSVNKAEIEGTTETGGIVGQNYGGTISTCVNMNNVTGTRSIGGIAGYNVLKGQILKCYNNVDGRITGTGENSAYIGGICGLNYTNTSSIMGTIDSCFSNGAVSSPGACTGGIVGQNSNILSNCYNTGTVYSKGAYSSGIAGINLGTYATISNCYNTGKVTGDVTDCVDGVTIKMERYSK